MIADILMMWKAILMGDKVFRCWVFYDGNSWSLGIMVMISHCNSGFPGVLREDGEIDMNKSVVFLTFSFLINVLDVLEVSVVLLPLREY